MHEPGRAAVGDVLAGRYFLQDELGQGGFGTVFTGLDRHLGRRVAVKVLNLPRDEGVADSLLGRFRREAWVTAQIKHPHVLTVHDFGSDDGCVFIVMDLLTGPSLAQMLMLQGPLGVAEVIRHGLAVAGALEVIHTCVPTVVHRDLKPGNLVLDASEIKLCDFGIVAVLASEMTRYTGTATVLGTPAYMSPEQCRGEQPQPSWDVFAFGAVLYALLDGESPFASPAGARASLDLVQHLEPDPIARRQSQVPPRLAALIHAMLAKAAANRPTAAEVRRELAAIAVSGPADPAPVPDVPAMPPTAAAPSDAAARFAAEFALVQDEYRAGRTRQAALRFVRLRDRAEAVLGTDHALVEAMHRFAAAMTR